jgi:uncharacterized protein DUF664
MQTVVRSHIQPLSGFRSQEAALFLAQMDDQLRLLREQTQDLTPDDLMWQPAPGMNTIGMLLAHLAVVEVWWTRFVLEGNKDFDVVDILGIGADDDGMPLAPDAPGFPLLNGRDIAFFHDLLDRSRAYVRETAKDRGDEDMEREVARERPDGSVRMLSVRWYYYHIFEHFCGHYGQILLLKHLRRATGR